MLASAPAHMTSLPELQSLLQQQQQAFAVDMNPEHKVRDGRLLRLEGMLEAWGPRMAAATQQDFGMRSAMVTDLSDLLPMRAALRHARRELRRWMRPQRRGTRWLFLPAHGYVQCQPLGVVGIIGPWNYPLQLLLAPLIGALAAGNRAMLKPSELAPCCSAILQQAVAEFFEADEVAVVDGGIETARAFAALPFDHLVFTGSTAVGRKIAAAAAAQLTPLTLELGGKSPVIVAASCNMALATRRIAWGKLFNGGQSCVAPDYALVERSCLPDFIEGMQRAVQQLYPLMAGNADYVSIINEGHLERLHRLRDDAISRGAQSVLLGAGADESRRQLPPQLLLKVDDSMSIMHEEIFGPLLPVLVWDRVEQALEMINARPRALALYWFGRDRAQQKQVLEGTISGGVSINDTMLHLVQENLPFGGVGASGYGHYHGEYGFRRFSLERAVFVQSAWSGTRLLYPPYNGWTRRLVDFLMRHA